VGRAHEKYVALREFWLSSQNFLLDRGKTKDNKGRGRGRGGRYEQSVGIHLWLNFRIFCDSLWIWNFTIMAIDIYYPVTIKSEHNFLTHAHFIIESSTFVCVRHHNACLQFLHLFNPYLASCITVLTSHVACLVGRNCRKMKVIRKLNFCHILALIYWRTTSNGFQEIPRYALTLKLQKTYRIFIIKVLTCHI